MADSADIVQIEPPGELIEGLKTADGVTQLLLRHHRKNPKGPPVLLAHGASAGSDTFRINEKKCLVSYLEDEGFDVWTLDWRASMNVARQLYIDRVRPGHAGPGSERDETIFTIDAAATNDVPAALRLISERVGKKKISLLGHCMGAGIIAQGIATGDIDPALFDNVVLSALGLFYRAALDNLVKSDDDSLSDLYYEQQVDLLHPTWAWNPDSAAPELAGDWDSLLQTPYNLWVESDLHHDCERTVCHRLSYLYGLPYDPKHILRIHDDHLDQQFGYVPVQFLLHCTRNISRGHAAGFPGSPNEGKSYLNHPPFRTKNITLITGQHNSLWHRDSIDTMYDWLRRDPARTGKLAKFVFPHYSHQDLLWGEQSVNDIFPSIRDGLKGQASNR